ncbi:uncharacterized protein LOC135097122 isoform X5 [Scylla paramamosain]|uniref:uncharacterized protein LOC135097122 isoform X5 n=1 Tax=Scylla paramamosain TaxID=85552 RepID=UPI003082700C
MGAGGSTVELAALGEAGTGREGRRVAREEASVCLPALIFEPETKASTTHFKASLEGFYGLILEKLVTEKFSDSSLAFPSTSSFSTMAQDG